MDDNEQIYALKVYRIGRTSFKKIKRVRSILGERTHFSWLYANRLAARKEIRALNRIYHLKLNTPKPIAVNRHMLLMSYLKGTLLAYYQSIDNPAKIFNKIIKQIKIIYQKAKMIHGDLGEFNIVVDDKGNILIIDWLQWVPSTHPNARALLERDIDNISNYFKKKFNVESDTSKILQSFYK